MSKTHSFQCKFLFFIFFGGLLEPRPRSCPYFPMARHRRHLTVLTVVVQKGEKMGKQSCCSTRRGFLLRRNPQIPTASSRRAARMTPRQAPPYRLPTLRWGPQSLHHRRMPLCPHSSPKKHTYRQPWPPTSFRSTHYSHRLCCLLLRQCHRAQATRNTLLGHGNLSALLLPTLMWGLLLLRLPQNLHSQRHHLRTLQQQNPLPRPLGLIIVLCTTPRCPRNHQYQWPRR